MSLEHSIRMLMTLLARLIDEISISQRHSDISEELRASLELDLERITNLDPRYRRLNYEEPYRLKLTCIRGQTRFDLATNAAPQSSSTRTDYASTSELVGISPAL